MTPFSVALCSLFVVVRGKVDKKETLYAGIETPRAQAITESNFSASNVIPGAGTRWSTSWR